MSEPDGTNDSTKDLATIRSPSSPISNVADVTEATSSKVAIRVFASLTDRSLHILFRLECPLIATLNKVVSGVFECTKWESVEIAQNLLFNRPNKIIPYDDLRKWRLIDIMGNSSMELELTVLYSPSPWVLHKFVRSISLKNDTVMEASSDHEVMRVFVYKFEDLLPYHGHYMEEDFERLASSVGSQFVPYLLEFMKTLTRVIKNGVNHEDGSRCECECYKDKWAARDILTLVTKLYGDWLFPYTSVLATAAMEQFYAGENEQLWALEYMPSLLVCSKRQGGAVSIWRDFWKAVKEEMENVHIEGEEITIHHFVSSVAKCLEIVDKEFVTEKEVEEIVEIMKTEVDGIRENREGKTRFRFVTLAGDEDYKPRSGDKLTMKAIVELADVGCKVVGERFSSHVRPVLTLLDKLTKEKNKKLERNPSSLSMFLAELRAECESTELTLSESESETRSVDSDEESSNADGKILSYVRSAYSDEDSSSADENFARRSNHDEMYKIARPTIFKMLEKVGKVTNGEERSVLTCRLFTMINQFPRVFTFESEEFAYNVKELFERGWMKMREGEEEKERTKIEEEDSDSEESLSSDDSWEDYKKEIDMDCINAFATLINTCEKVDDERTASILAPLIEKVVKLASSHLVMLMAVTKKLIETKMIRPHLDILLQVVKRNRMRDRGKLNEKLAETHRRIRYLIISNERMKNPCLSTADKSAFVPYEKNEEIPIIEDDSNMEDEIFGTVKEPKAKLPACGDVVSSLSEVDVEVGEFN